jgi:hypothetical protein
MVRLKANAADLAGARRGLDVDPEMHRRNCWCCCGILPDDDALVLVRADQQLRQVCLEAMDDRPSGQWSFGSRSAEYDGIEHFKTSWTGVGK